MKAQHFQGKGRGSGIKENFASSDSNIRRRNSHNAVKDAGEKKALSTLRNFGQSFLVSELFTCIAAGFQEI